MSKEINNKTEGWANVQGSRKFHYFRNYVSLCKKALMLRHPSVGYEIGNDNSPDNCAKCKKTLAKLRSC